MKEDKSIRQGMRLTLFGLGKGLANLFSLSAHNRIVTAINAFLNLRVVPGSRLDFKVSDGNAVITVPGVNAAGAATAAHPFQITQTTPGDPDNWLNVQVAQGIVTYRQLTNTLGNFGGLPAVTNFATNIAAVENANNVVYLDLFAGLIVVTDADDGLWADGWGNSDNARYVIGFADTTDTTGRIITITQRITASADYFCDSIPSLYTTAIPTISIYSPAPGWTFEINKTIVIGKTVLGFPSDGLYLYIGSGGVGPGSAWFKA